MNRRLLVAFALLPVAGIALGCASSSQGNVRQQARPDAPPDKVLSKVPDWWNKPPKDDNYIFGQATSLSRDLQMATDMAEGDARNRIAQQLEIKFDGMGKRFAEQTGSGQDAELLNSYTNAWKSVVSQVLVGSRARDTKTMPEGSAYRVYVLMEMPVGKASEAMLERLRASQAMYTRFRASQAFQELDSEVQKYQEWKKNQTP